MTEQRRLAAILVADVVGYSKLIGGDEAGTLAQLEALRTSIILDGWPTARPTPGVASAPALNATTIET